MRNLANVLTGYVGRTVMDETGLTQLYDFSLNCAARRRYQSTRRLMGILPVLLECSRLLSEQTGLRLETKRLPIETLVVDRVGKLTAN
jgi:uncharacterized protein (TIGR03435 family)